MLLGEIINEADNQFIENVNKHINLEQKEKLEILLNSKESNITKLAWLREDVYDGIMVGKWIK